jgi:hypothetical protein
LQPSLPRKWGGPTFGVPDVTVWNRLKEGDAILDWDSVTWVVHWSTAKRVADESAQRSKNPTGRTQICAAVRRKRRSARPEVGRRRAAERAAAAGRPVHRGVEVSYPGDSEEPDWMKED